MKVAEPGVAARDVVQGSLLLPVAYGWRLVPAHSNRDIVTVITSEHRLAPSAVGTAGLP